MCFAAGFYPFSSLSADRFPELVSLADRCSDCWGHPTFCAFPWFCFSDVFGRHFFQDVVKPDDLCLQVGQIVLAD